MGILMNDLIIKEEDVKRLSILVDYADGSALIVGNRTIRNAISTLKDKYPSLKS